MKLLNAKLELSEVNSVTTTEWQIAANLIDMSGSYFTSDISIGDNVFCYGLNQNTGETDVCKYKVLEKLAGTKALRIVCIITWAEDNEDYADPQTGMECIIGKTIQGNLTAITNSNNDISNMMIETARNIDLACASFSGGSSKRETVIVNAAFISNKKYTILNAVKDNSEIVILNGAVLTKGLTNDYVLNNNTLSFNTSLVFYEDDVLVILYMV